MSKGFMVAEFSRFVYWVCVSAVVLGIASLAVSGSLAVDWQNLGYLVSAGFSLYFLEIAFDFVS